MNFNDMLRKLVERGASDLHLHVGLPPLARLHGKLTPIADTAVGPRFTEALVDLMCDERQKMIFQERHQVDLAYAIAGVSRFRVNLFRQRGSISAVLRIVNSDEATLRIVNMPQATIDYFRDQEQGIVLVTGATGSGKSTTLARLIDEINRTHNKMIVTIEDPIEFIHKSKKSAVVQREIGMDATSFAESLVAAMRQDPDVIMIGEIRDRSTASAAITAAQTGHLVFATLHTMDSVRTINRMIDLFPQDERDTMRILFAEALVGIVSQRLLPRVGGSGRVAAMEIMKATLRIKDLIKDERRSGELYDAIKDARLDGMQLFDDHLAQLYAEDAISYETAMAAATSAAGFKIAATQVDVTRDRPTATQWT
jgi:twitching motility protein PilT